MPKVGFVSLGCPKALVDSEAILTQLRTEGYDISPSYEGSDLVVVITDVNSHGGMWSANSCSRARSPRPAAHARTPTAAPSRCPP